MASDVSKSGALKQSWRASAFASLQEFLAKFASEIVQLQKKDLRSVANSSQSNKHAEWKQARNFFVRHFDFLPLEEKALLQDWELVLCDVSSLESVALLSGLQRCFERVDAFFKEHAEALKKLGAKNLDTALRSRHMAQFPMATFTRLFLERYEEQLETKQLESMSTWKENLCAQRALDEEEKSAKRRKAFLQLQEFFGKFASEIAQLQKKDLKSVANSSQSNKHAEWKQARNFFLRHFEFLPLEEKALLQDWELVLCDVSSLESVALLSGFQRCFERVDAFFKEHAEALKKLGAKNLDTALRSRHMAQFPLAMFARLFLEKFEKQLATAEVEVLSMWQAQLCAVTAAEQEAVTAKRKKALLDIQEFFAKFAADIVELQKKDLRSVVMSYQATKHSEWKRAQHGYVLLSASLTVEEKALLQDWELVLCDVSSLESVALLSGLQRCFERVDAFLKEHAEALKKLGAKNLDTALRSRHMGQFPLAMFARLFLEKFEKQLATAQVEVLSMWQAQLCAVTAAEQETVTAKRKKAVLDIQEFFAKFAADIVELQKKDLRSVVMSSEAKKHAEWKRAQHGYLLLSASLTVEEKALLQDWELVLCDVSSLESVALLSGLQRCFERVDALFKEHAQTLQKLAAKNLDAALRSRHMAQFPMSTFTRLFLEKFEKQLATEQVEVLSMWQAQLCAVTAAEQETVTAKRKKAVLDIQEFFAKFAADIVELQKKDLRSVVMSSEAKKHAEWKRAQHGHVEFMLGMFASVHLDRGDSDEVLLHDFLAGCGIQVKVVSLIESWNSWIEASYEKRHNNEGELSVVRPTCHTIWGEKTRPLGFRFVDEFGRTATVGFYLVHDPCPFGDCVDHVEMLGFGTICNHWHGFNPKHGKMCTLAANRALQYGQIGNKGRTTRGARGSGQYFKDFLQKIGMVAPAGSHAVDADERVCLVGLPRWLPAWYGEGHGPEGETLVPFHAHSNQRHFVERERDRCLVLATHVVHLFDDMKKLCVSSDRKTSQENAKD